eukprot:CAMPEP_0194335200 /NCGR_PEP_ID=MMETSP0171-20130528/68771_1 /TAXON_ID=218684 /ORGANISM="Corethron pennatum, Strain L29A3" /LENGTH=89 /DNA_ID=CAMNT_0039098175 /DNA_START=52 /DNA_END=317 /DNA_ORIENTATION=+
MDFDQDRIYYSAQNLQSSDDPAAPSGGPASAPAAADDGPHRSVDPSRLDRAGLRRQFADFFRNYHVSSRLATRYPYRELLLALHRRGPT